MKSFLSFFKKLTLCVVLLNTMSNYSFAQNALTLKTLDNKEQSIGFPFNSYTYSNGNSGEITILQHVPNFNSFGIGWQTINQNENPHDFHIDYRYKKEDNTWSNWLHAHGEISPSETPTTKFWSTIIITDYLQKASVIQLKLVPPSGTVISSVQLDGSFMTNSERKLDREIETSINRASNCPSQPFIFQRGDWWANLTSDELYYPNATNVKTVNYNTNTTHAFVHHGASTNNYTDGAAVVRSYWSYHVNSRGWKDIGYNYLIDKFGNLYMGRYNDNWPNIDALGAHTGVCNPYSFAICCIGDYATTPLPQVALDELYKMLAYKCDIRGLNPTGTGFIYNANIDIISGHRDAPLANTTCPGNGMHGILSSIRNNVQSILNNCASNPTTNTDNTPPVTSINYTHKWERDNFSMTVNDLDDSSGISNKFVNISYFDSLKWDANAGNGYFNDQFTYLTTKWNQVVGNWQHLSTHAKQTDETEANTIFSAYLNQDDENAYLYHWRAQIGGTGTNKRAGLHFMCSSDVLADRGDSYMVYFREDNGKIQIYKTLNNILYLKVDTIFTFNPNAFYDCKVTFNKMLGKINVYVNNYLVASHTDSSPLTLGSYTSFRTGNCTYSIDFFEAYKNRSANITASVGVGLKDIPYQNFSPTSPAGQIKSIAIDGAENISLTDSRYIQVDWSKPTPVYANDGATGDVDTVFRNDKITGNWGGSDQNSGVKNIYIGVGSTPGVNNIISWTDIGLINQYTIVASLNFGSTYYVNFHAFNGAGLDTIISTDGQLIFGTSAINENKATLSELSIYPNPYSDIFTISFNSKKEFSGNFILIDVTGKVVYSQKNSIVNGINNVLINTSDSHLNSGYYFLKLDSDAENILLGIKTIKK
jgi:hypothetical protein